MMKMRMAWVGCGVALLGLGCPADSKSVGTENDEGGAEDSGTSNEPGDDDGATSLPGDGAGDTVAESGGIPCSNEDGAAPECWTCVCDMSTGTIVCSDEACLTDCTGSACGTQCWSCSPSDPECDLVDEVGMCNAEGACVPEVPDLCEAGLLPGFEDDLGPAGGCADLIVYATDADYTFGIIVVIEGGIVEDSGSGRLAVEGTLVDGVVTGTPYTGTVDVRVGTHIGYNTCSDVIDGREVVDQTWLATSGNIAVNVYHPDPEDDGLTTASVVLTDVVFTHASGQVEVAEIVLAEPEVGWLPG
jgi:hypothetical protein